MLHEALIAPFAEFGFLRRALVGCLAVSLSAPPLGVFLMLRRMSLTGDVLAHGILPGVALGFVVAGLWLPALALGGLLAGLVVALGAGALARATGGREDAALTGLYLTALAAGVTLISWRGSAVELTQLLFGSVLGVDDAALLLMGAAATATLLFLAFAWRPLILECFDPSFARAVGVRGSVWHLGLLALVVGNLVSALQAVGSLMAVGLMMLPAIAARHLAREVGGMVLAAVSIALGATVTGLLASYHLDLPSGPAIVLAAAAAWVMALVFGPVDGLLARHRPRRHLDG
ncbi:metal ABC transporter permease [Roseococcus sp. SDR]|uniref:metal ABC transporter permease n=1 Tax=Roseococcus sp. SDR TaxID=2835532 RepID=UPI001BD08EE4|nr:metal ABC transporter permease [Roseococcus sp. SDR]MBS7792804.1 metal ABC transporter permease [Roseococcus sp. SDR]MBV1848118.1 metal ABC transporter permease [Roseococcus sp. SDR]